MNRYRSATYFLLGLGLLLPRFVTAQQQFNPGGTPAASTSAAPSAYKPPVFKQRLLDYVDRSAGPVAEGGVALQAAIAQRTGEPEAWGHGGNAYGKRFAWAWSANWIAESTRFAACESFRLDSTFRDRSPAGVAPRVRRALATAFLARTRSGKVIVSAPSIAAPYAGAFYSVNAWYPGTPTWKQGLKAGSISLAMQPALNLLREFVFKH